VGAGLAAGLRRGLAPGSSTAGPYKIKSGFLIPLARIKAWAVVPLAITILANVS
jgi:hypothetical protein